MRGKKDKFTFKEILFIVVLFALTIGFSYYYNSSGVNSGGEISEVCFENNCFEIEIADSAEERQTGLMFRESLGRDKGMLFIFEEEDIHPFWMKNTLISLDIIWIDSNKEIVFINENTPACESKRCPIYSPNEQSLYVLELDIGVANEIGLKVGDRVRFK